MTVLVAFDGSELSKEALDRASEFADATGEPLVAVSVVPTGKEYAREQGWIEDGEEFAVERVIERLRRSVLSIAPDARFRNELLDRYAPPGTIASRIRQVAGENDASVVFVGSDRAGGLVSTIDSVAGTVAADETYDVYIVRDTDGSENSSS